MDLSGIAETRIKQAIEKGELKGLPAEGKPLEFKYENPYLTKEERLLEKILASSGALTKELLLLKKIEDLQQKIAGCKADEKDALTKELEAKPRT